MIAYKAGRLEEAKAANSKGGKYCLCALYLGPVVMVTIFVVLATLSVIGLPSSGSGDDDGFDDTDDGFK